MDRSKQYEDTEYGQGNPFDPENEPAEYQQWAMKHPSAYTRNDSDTKTDWLGIALNMAAGVAPFVAQGALAGAASPTLSGSGMGTVGLGPGATLAGGTALPGAGAALGGTLAPGTAVGLGTGVGAAEGAEAAIPTLGAAVPNTSAGLASTLGAPSTLASPVAPSLSAAGGVTGLGADGSLAGGTALPGAAGLDEAGYAAGAAMPASAASAAGGGVASTIAKYLGKYGVPAGTAIGGATKAAAANRDDENNYEARLFQLLNNAQAQRDRDLVERGVLEGSQRKSMKGDLYRDAVANNPNASPYNPRPNMPMTPAMLATLDNLSKQAQDELGKSPAYLASKMPAIQTYPSPSYKKPGTMEQVGNWLAPLLTAAGYFI